MSEPHQQYVYCETSEKNRIHQVASFCGGFCCWEETDLNQYPPTWHVIISREKLTQGEATDSLLRRLDGLEKNNPEYVRKLREAPGSWIGTK